MTTLLVLFKKPLKLTGLGYLRILTCLQSTTILLSTGILPIYYHVYILLIFLQQGPNDPIS